MTQPDSAPPYHPHPLSPFRLDPPPSRRDALLWVIIGGLMLFMLNAGVPYHAWVALSWTRAEATITGATLREPTRWQPRRSHWIDFSVTLPHGREVPGRSATSIGLIRMLQYPYRTGADRMMPNQPPPIGARLDVFVSPGAPHQVVPVGQFAPGLSILLSPFLLVVFVRGLFHLRRRRPEPANA
ncbi:DUF3592 domain-containing protein [Neoroseomonas rubea]|uniref:DUF3592 domain-containing protein n=1 Tax=Neoroseomonas rubea TaxID=2748666 RepID=UPI0018DFBA30|nr:hypothetical protein [Roseomonas rubea]